ncbi:MAG: DUF979 domain-containing protein [Verrucomicrobiae bacterium]|nr:DUF979 domain-containing protein [Verrucomicrobiae bacterium]
MTAEPFYKVAACVLIVIAVRIALRPGQARRFGTAAFWLLLGISFGVGTHLPPQVIGWMVTGMIVLAATGQVVGIGQREDRSAERESSARKLGNRLLFPTLAIPVIIVLGGIIFKYATIDGVSLVASSQATHVSLGLAAVIAWGMALWITRARPMTAFDEGGRLLQDISWAVILPQMLAALGGIFAAAGVGDVIAKAVGATIPTQYPVVAVVAYCTGMTLFTIIMGNAFAAFPVITLGIGLPFIVEQHGGNPAFMASLGMLSGYCGTLVTPMAANFNLVPAILLELEDRNAVIKAQLPFAVALWLFNVLVMAGCVYWI